MDFIPLPTAKDLSIKYPLYNIDRSTVTKTV
jgi:hypothetical protein